MKTTVLLIFLFPLSIFGQDLTGTWIGRESGASYLKLVIVQAGDSCYGYTYDKGPGFCKADFAGKFDKEKQKLKGRGTAFIERSFDHVLAVYNLNYSKEGEEEWLDGAVAAKSAGALILSLGIPGYAELKKVTGKVDTTGFMAAKIISFKNKQKVIDTRQSFAQKEKTVGIKDTDSLNLANRIYPGTIKNAKEERTSGIIKTIVTNADTVKMMLYDNGVVDDDTVTLFFDNAVILDRYRITEKAKEIYIPLAGNGQSHVVELFANNLGTIPPNTALVIIIAGNERYEVKASFDLSTNAKIIFQHKE